jgi:hypothetical protein
MDYDECNNVQFGFQTKKMNRFIWPKSDFIVEPIRYFHFDVSLHRNRAQHGTAIDTTKNGSDLYFVIFNFMTTDR